MGLTDKHLAYGDDIPQTQAEKDYYWKLKDLKEKQQQPCKDCISRQAVLEVLNKNRYRFNISQEGCCEGKVLWSGDLIKDNACKEIEQLPSVTPKEKTGWIPVSERLPEDGQSVLFCDIDNDIMIGYHVKGRPDTHFSQDGTYEDIKDVRAWMPLPEPYRAESEEK